MGRLAMFTVSFMSVILVACGVGRRPDPDRQAQYVCAVHFSCPDRGPESTQLLIVALPVMSNAEPPGNVPVLDRELRSIVGSEVGCPPTGEPAVSWVRCKPLRTRFSSVEHLAALGDTEDGGGSQ